jgi:hypothetical protein
MFAPVYILRKWCEQRPGNKGDLDLSVMGEAGRVYYMGEDLLLITFLYHSTQLLLDFIVNGTPRSFLSWQRAIILKSHNLLPVVEKMKSKIETRVMIF